MAGHPQNAHLKLRPTLGLTIVELLIVIVVIGILAAITIVAFNGVTAKAREATMKANLSSLQKKLMAERVESELYPTSLASVGVTAPNGGTYQYTVNNSVSPATYCVSYVIDGVGFFINQNDQPAVGVCPGHGLTGVTAPSTTGYYNFVASTTLADLPMPTISDGSWMMIVMAYTDTTTPETVVAPADWTTLIPRYSIGTLRTMVFGKIKTSNEPSTFSLTGSDMSKASGVLMWGSGASTNLSSWIKGTGSSRDGSSTPQQYITTASAVSTTAAQSLVLTISTERTTLSEADISSVTGSTKWFFIPQTANKIQTITVSSTIAATPSTTSPVVTTYPNPQVLNGYAVQIALPPI